MSTKRRKGGLLLNFRSMGYEGLEPVDGQGDRRMTKKGRRRHSPEQIVKKLRVRFLTRLKCSMQNDRLRSQAAEAS